MCLEFESQTILGSFLPVRLHLKLPGLFERYFPQNDADKAPEDDATLVHETMHFYQTIFTGYGQYLWQVNFQTTGFVVAEWINLTAKTPTQRRLPLAWFAQEGREQAALAYVIDEAARTITGFARGRHTPSREMLTVRDLGIRGLEQSWEVSPTIEHESGNHRISGHEVFESHAQYLEAVYSYVVNGIPFSTTYDKLTLPGRYWIPFEWFCNQVGPDWHIAFPIILDLALQTLWRDPPRTEAEWRAGHPGWRFVTLTEALKSNRNRLTQRTVEGMRSGYKEFIGALCAYCDFPSLDDVLDDRIRAFQTLEELTRFQSLMLKSLEYRKEVPWYGAHPFLDMEEWTRNRSKFIVPLVEAGDGLRVMTLPLSIASNEWLREFTEEAIANIHYEALAEQILGNFTGVALSRRRLSCGYNYRGISRGCPYQGATEGCNGLIDPVYGTKYPVTYEDSFTIRGCPFEMSLGAMGLKCSDLSLDQGRRLPVFDEIAGLRSG